MKLLKLKYAYKRGIALYISGNFYLGMVIMDQPGKAFQPIMPCSFFALLHLKRS